MGIYKIPRPFNHIFGGDRILRAWYRGIKNAGPRKRAQGRAQDTPYHIMSPYHNGIWRIFIECGKKPHARKSAQGRSARGPILPKRNRNFRQPPYVFLDISSIILIRTMYIIRIWYSQYSQIIMTSHNPCLFRKAQQVVWWWNECPISGLLRFQVAELFQFA